MAGFRHQIGIAGGIGRHVGAGARQLVLERGNAHRGRLEQVVQRGRANVDRCRATEADIVIHVIVEADLPGFDRAGDAVVGEALILKIAKLAAKYIKKPTSKAGEPGKDADPQSVVEQVVEMLRGGKVKIHVNSLEGLDQTLEPFKDLVRRHGSVRGGGDTVVAGTGIVLTRNASGTTTIASTSAPGTPVYEEIPTGSGTAFTLAHTPIAGTLRLYRGGARQQVGAGKDYMVSGASITLSITLDPNEVLIADYEY